MKISKLWIRICNIACAVLMVALLIMQCLPFWTMPTCECTELRCELEVNTDCPACAITKTWCVVPTSCTCKYICDYSATDMNCPVCREDIDCCFSQTPSPASKNKATEPTEEFLPVEDTVEPLATGAVVAEKFESSEEIKHVQTMLKKLGYYLGEYGENADGIDGINGPLTQNAIRDFQKAMGIKVDGIPGAKTVALLEKVTGNMTDAPVEPKPEEPKPEETVPEETVPEETVPEETVPEETVPEETVPEETVPVLKPTGPIPEDAGPVTVSIQEFTWLSTFDSCEGVFKYFDGVYSVKKTATTEKYDFMLNDIIGMPVAVFFFALISVFLCIIKSDKTWIALFPLATGIIAVFGYLSHPIYQAGALWQLHLGISIAILVISLIPNIASILNIINWFRPNKKS